MQIHTRNAHTPPRNKQTHQKARQWVVGAIERIAASSGLGSLSTFDWDGLEVPRDGLWRTLRECCPKLKSVFTNIGTKPLDPHSELFNFTDLTSFSLVLRHGLGGNELFPPLEPLPPGLWNMLTTSPNLEELAICSFSSSTRILDFSPLSLLTFPKLHTLTLGSFGYQSDFTLGPAELWSISPKHH
ncbi:hypothetical protein BDQ17DRAFT_1374962 [Cyathus striatus]|nr:hypothetical protein BDQ17DRAFT_1374962 [Cyathus striatus]